MEVITKLQFQKLVGRDIRYKMFEKEQGFTYQNRKETCGSPKSTIPEILKLKNKVTKKRKLV